MKTSIEITDSRYGSPLGNSVCPAGDYVADNCRGGVLVLGEKSPWISIDLATTQSDIYVNLKKLQTSEHSETLNAYETLIKFLNLSVKDEHIQVKEYMIISFSYSMFVSICH